MLKVKDLIKEIKKQKRKNIYIGYLGFVENQDLNQELESYFVQYNYLGAPSGFDWVNGNKKLLELEQQIYKEMEKAKGL